LKKVCSVSRRTEAAEREGLDRRESEQTVQ
jgi:hypothetical protein